MRPALLAMLLSLVLTASAAARLPLPDPLPPVAHNPADALTGVPIEPFGYEGATHCTPHARRRGVARFTRWLEHTSRGVSWGTYRCEKWSKHEASLHAESRALDWHLDVTRPADARAAKRLVLLLLAPDRTGEPQALARRMGVEEIIWDCGYLSVGMTQFSKYAPCFDKHGHRLKHVDPTQGHRNHIHSGFTRAGANGRTSSWSLSPRQLGE